MKRGENPTIAHLKAWGTWKATAGKAQGWGGGVMLERSGWGKPDASTHSDPTLAEVQATIADGQSLSQHIDTSMSEYYPVYKLMMRARYQLQAEWAEIAEALNISVEQVEVMHRFMLRNIGKDIGRYFRRREALRDAREAVERMAQAEKVALEKWRKLCAA